jgi:hypothetical protein
MLKNENLYLIHTGFIQNKMEDVIIAIGLQFMAQNKVLITL